MSSRPLLCAAAVVAAALPAHRLAAQAVDVIRGRVTGPDRQSVENVQVTVTSISGNVNRTARTDKNGRYTVTFPNGDGDYFVTFNAVGFAPKRYEVKRVSDEDFLLADARLDQSATQLDAVKVTAARDKVGRNANNQPDIGGTEKRIENGAVPAEQVGDLAAMAASLPGVTAVAGADGDPAGFSVLGLSADQNQSTLNGMNMGGSNIPRDAGVMSSLVTSPYDVSVGGFSGARFNIRTRPGTNYVQRAGSLYGTAPQVQWTDAAARALGQQTTNLSLGGSASGPLVYNKAFYTVSYQLGRSANDLHTLLNTSAVGLQATGIAADSVSRLTTILGLAKVPTVIGRLPTSRLNDNGSLFGSFDLTPPSSNTGQSFNVAFNGGWNRQTPASQQLATEFPSHSGDRTSWNAGMQGRHSSYVKNILLSETQLGLSSQRSWASPYLDLPSGTVLVNSSFADGTNGVRLLSFGGSPSMNTSQTSTSAGLTNQLSWFSSNNKHRLKLASELRRDGYTQDQTSNLLGSFTFNSLGDLEANRPASFSRSLSARVRSGSGYVGAVSLGDSYKRSPTLQFQYGLRVDANHFVGGPVDNPDVERVFGTPNDAVPNRLYVSPRLGFSWAYGQASQVGAFEGAARGPRAVIRGGVGMFQNTPGASLLGSAIDNTGLPSGLQQITCVGPAAPVPSWNAYEASNGSIPNRCVDGSTGTLFANAAPNVTLLAKDYQATRSLRSNLSWSGAVLRNRFNLSLDGTYSLNMNQAGFVDRNFAEVTRFTLADEGGRPVFVQPSSIVPLTGAIASRDARVSPLFARVTEQRSDLRSESKQLSVGISPITYSSKLSWGLTYTMQDIRERTNGFTSTAGSPLSVAWGPSAGASRHQFNYNVGYNLFDALRLSWYGNVRSGMRFTPQIAGDVNGDGYANDRAYIFDPARTADPALATAMGTLLADGSSVARDCLRSQLGTVATRNSCVGPWSHSANLSIGFNPLKVRMPQRTTLSFSVSNPLGAADRLLHGEDNLRGWGQTTFPDAALFYVRGFDATTKRYKYEVNQRFGSTNPTFNAFRQPVTVTAMLRVDVGPTRERQNLTQMLDRGRRHEGSKLPEGILKAMYGTGGIPNPMAQILRQADTLKLSGPQADSLATMNRWYAIRVDSIWSPVAKFLADLPSTYDQGEAYDRYRTARRASVDLLAKLAPEIKGVLTADQRRKLPVFVASYLDPRYLASIRSGTAGSGGMPMFMGGGGGFAGMGGGGGERTVIIR